MKIQNCRLKLVRENVGEYKVQDFKINSPKTVVNVITTVFDIENDTQENFGVLFLDTRNKIIGAELITRGTVDSCLVSPRDILQRALMIGAVSVIVFHNHPSGDVTPSKEDRDLTNRLKNACQVVGINLLDHIIIGDSGHMSFTEEGIL